MMKATYYYDSMGTLHVWKGWIIPDDAEHEGDFILSEAHDIEQLLGMSVNEMSIGDWDQIKIHGEYFE